MLRTALTGLAGLLLATSATAQVQTVTLYQDSVYRGASITLPLPPAGVPLVFPSSFRNRVTSLRWNLAPGTVVYGYTNANLTGREYCITHSQPRQGADSNVGSEYNDDLESLRWFPVDPNRGWVRMFTDADYGGYQLTRYLSLTGLGTISIKDLGYNDQVDALQWSLPRDRTVMCYDEDPVGGRALPLIDAGQIADLNRAHSGFHHDKFSTIRILDGQYTAALADRDAPLDRVCQLAAHNAHCSAAQGWIFWYQQNLTILEQLDYGARLLQLDVREQNGQLFLTHGSWSQSIAQRGGLTPEPLAAIIDQIADWLAVHTKEVLVLEFENYTGSTLTTFLERSRIGSRLYRPQHNSWPSINQLVAAGRRVIVFDSSSSTSQQYSWDWMVQNGYSSFGDIQPRSESGPINRSDRSLFFMNHISGTSTPLTWLGNSPNDKDDLVRLAGQFAQVPNWIGIDGIEMADHGGLEACRVVNGLLWQLPRKSTSYRFHSGCGPNLSTRTLPTVGSTYAVTAAPLAAVMIGFQDRFFGGGTLPSDFGGLGRCLLRVSPDVVESAAQTAVLAFPIPSDVGLVGVPLYLQSARFASGRLEFSGAITATIGF